MATLEKIRSKSVLLLIIVGAALLAFIIGDFFTSGRTLFGTGTTLATAGNQKIDIQEFQRRVQQAQQEEQQSGRHSDPAVLQQQVLDAMITEKLLGEEFDKLGLVVTDAELSEMMLGKNSQMIDRIVQQQFNLPDAATFHDIAFNPTKYGVPQEQAVQYQQAWIAFETDVENMLLQRKFQNLFTGTITANELDARAIYDDMAPTATAIYAKKDLSSLPDDQFPVESADIDKIYSSERGLYAIDEPTRLVNYITVNIVPSQADILAAQKAVEDAIMALNNGAAPGAEELSKFIVENVKMSQTDVDRQARLKTALETLEPGHAVLVSKDGNDYTVARLNSIGQAPENVKLDFMMVQGSKAQIDSLTAELNNGISFDSIAASPLVARSQKDQEVSLLDSNSDMVKELIEGRATGVYFAPDTVDQGMGRIVRVAERPAPVTVYDLTMAALTVEPSNATINDLEARLQNYLRTHDTAKEFVDSAQEAGYTTFPAYVTASSPSLGNLTDSHSAVAWAMEAKKGQVSPVFGDIQTGHFIAVALDDIYTDYRPATDPQIATTLTNRARNNKKAESLIGEYSGKAKDVPGYAALMKTGVDTTTVNFSQYMVPGIGVGESDLIGAVAAGKAGQLIGPMQTNNAVVVLQITGINTDETRPYNFEESAFRFNQARGAMRLGGYMPRILLGKTKVKNNMTTFYK